MEERRTVRVVLLDPNGRVLLMKGGVRFSARPAPTWFPIGGGIEPGESLAEAALREVTEETGLISVDLGPTIWFGQAVFQMRTGPVLFRETFILATTKDTRLSREGWDESERGSVVDMRWWTADEMRSTADAFYPSILPSRLHNLRAGLVDHLQSIELT